jgi:transposase
LSRGDRRWPEQAAPFAPSSGVAESRRLLETDHGTFHAPRARAGIVQPMIAYPETQTHLTSTSGATGEMITTRQPYPSDLSDVEWGVINEVVPSPKSGGRPAKYSRREVVNALLYIRRTRCQWRELPHDFPPWKLVYWYFMEWRASGLLDRIDNRLRSFAPRTTLPPTAASPLLTGSFMRT